MSQVHFDESYKSLLPLPVIRWILTGLETLPEIQVDEKAIVEMLDNSESVLIVDLSHVQGTKLTDISKLTAILKGIFSHDNFEFLFILGLPSNPIAKFVANLVSQVLVKADKRQISADEAEMRSHMKVHAIRFTPS